MARKRWERIALAALLVGVALRLVAPFAMDVWEDGGEYVAMGHSLAANGTLWLPSGEDHGVVASTGQPGESRHFAPAFPFALSLFYRAFGPSLLVTKVALATLSVATVAVVWACTRDLYPPAATWTAALVALEPDLVWATGRGYSENLAVLFFALTLWAIVRSLRDERFILLAGLFAGLAFLTRASMGPFFLVAGFGGLAWRVWQKGWWRTLASVPYLGAVAIFGAIVGAWSLRNVLLFGWPHWETSAYIANVYAYAGTHLARYGEGLAGKTLFFAAALAVYAAPFGPQLRAQLARWREEETSALLLSIALVVALAILVTAALFAYEPVPVWFLEHHRYVVPMLVPLAWLALREATPRDAALRAGALAVVFLLLCAALFVAPERDSEARAAEWLAPHARPGDLVGVHYMTTYDPYPILAGTGARPVPYSTVTSPPEFVMAKGTLPNATGYALLAEIHERVVLRPDSPVFVYARADVAAARGLPTNLTVWSS